MIRLSVPATSANLGPGFDCLSLALEWRNEMTVSLAPADSFEVEGEGADSIDPGPDNLIFRSIDALYAESGRTRPPLAIHLQNRFPIGRGLGSSAAAVVGGLTAANVLLDLPADEDEIFRLANRLDGHPDNVASALAGGLIVTWGNDYRRFDPPPLHLTVAIPSHPMGTEDARRILPDAVPRQDAVFNLQRVALWLTILRTGEWDLLHLATDDRLHQPYRESLLPGLAQTLGAVRSAGALGAVLSGSGSAVLAFSRNQDSAIDTALRHGLGEETLIHHLTPSRDGVRIEEQ